MAIPELSRFQKFEAMTVSRRELKNAPYNPRVISDKNRAKLKRSLEKVGLIEAIVWNKRTGNIVGGHQRIKALDSLHDGPDYSLTVAVVDLDPKTEKEQNIALNNSESQGEWDLEKLEELFAEGLNVESTAFDAATLIKLFGNVPGEESSADAEDLERIAASVDAAKKIRANLSDKKNDPFGDDMQFYTVLVGGSDLQGTRINEALGLEDNRYQDMRLLPRLIGLFDSEGIPRARLLEWVAGLHDDKCNPVLMDPVASAAASDAPGEEFKDGEEGTQAP